MGNTRQLIICWRGIGYDSGRFGVAAVGCGEERCASGRFQAKSIGQQLNRGRYRHPRRPLQAANMANTVPCALRQRFLSKASRSPIALE